MIPVRCLMLCLVCLPIGSNSAPPETNPPSDSNSTSDTESTSDMNTALDSSDTSDPDLADADADGRKPPVPETPEAAFQSIKQALKNGDIYTFVACLSDDSQASLVSTVLPTLHAIPDFKPDRKDEVAVFMKRHGISPYGKPKVSNNIEEHNAMMADMHRQAGLVKDKPQFLTDFDKFAPGTTVGLFGHFSLVEVVEVTINRNSASAQTTIGKRDGPMKLKRENGGWRVHIYNKDGSAANAKGD